MRTISFVILMGPLAGCFGGNATYDGTIGGKEFDVQDAAYFTKFYPSENQPSGVSLTVTSLVISTSYAMCQDIEEQILHSKEEFLVFTTVTEGGDETTTATGTFNLNPTAGPTFGEGFFGGQATDCSPLPNTQVDSGSITFDEANYAAGGAAKGKFDVTYSTSDHGTGTFNATACSAIETFSDDLVAYENGTNSAQFYLIYGPCTAQ